MKKIPFEELDKNYVKIENSDHFFCPQNSKKFVLSCFYYDDTYMIRKKVILYITEGNKYVVETIEGNPNTNEVNITYFCVVEKEAKQLLVAHGYIQFDSNLKLLK